MIDDPNKPDAPTGPARGEEPEEESGAGYGNHAPDEAQGSGSAGQQEAE